MAEEIADEIVDWSVYSSVRFELGANFVRILGYFHEDGGKAVTRIEAAMHAKDAAAMIIPAHTMKSEARQFGAIPLAVLAEDIETAARHAVEMQLFPDDILPQVAQLRPLYRETIGLLMERANPLQQRRAGGFGNRA